ncbi:MAG: accessory gene regulator B family protein [Syntrophomonadaceae bacterium]|nr:accessory gene regulator B family protein [Syntrophomonadaceae bacterium]
MSIHDLSCRCAAYLAQQLEADQIKENRMAFGLELLLGEIVKLFFIIALAYALGILPEVLTITVTAGILRLASGGEHCSAYYRCLIGGTACFLLLGWIAHILNPVLIGTGLWLTVVIASLLVGGIIGQYAPGDTENKPINTEAERIKFKKWSLLVLFLYIVIMIILMQFETVSLLVLPMLIGMLEQAFTITPWGYRFLHWVDRVLGGSET